MSFTVNCTVWWEHGEGAGPKCLAGGTLMGLRTPDVCAVRPGCWLGHACLLAPNAATT